MLEYQSRSLGGLQFDSIDFTLPLVVHRPARRFPVHQALRAPADGALVKRVVDVVLALLVLTVLAVPMLLIALAIWLDSPGPALFRQRRVGLNGSHFEMLKFRTMRHHGASTADCRQASRYDPRVTRVGYWLRCLSADELPQLINVLRGEMSIVGPRPHTPGTRAGGRLFEEVAPRYDERHRMRPGITGLAQVRGWRGETDTEDKLLRRIDSDLEYIENWSAGLDLWILCCTIGTVMRMRNAY
jgi:lipopolysaccharide/colanic/teichoic acid biosynthesis glycosyltransferase